MNGNLKSASFRVCIGIMALAAVLAIACSRDAEVPPSPTPVNVQAIVQEALDTQPPSMTDADVAQAIQQALAAQPGVTEDQVGDAITSALAERPSMTEADVAQAVQQALAAQPGVTEDQVGDAIIRALAERPGVTEGDVQEVVESAVAKAMAAADSTALEPDVPLIPRQVLFGNPDKIGVELSYDGRFLSYVAPVAGVLNVWVGPANDPAAAQPVTQDTNRGIRSYSWAYTNSHILYTQDRDGDENYRLYRVDVTTGETRDLTPLEGVAARIQEKSPKFPGELLVSLNDRDPRFHDVYRLDINTGERELVQENDGFGRFITDDDFNVRFAIRPTADGGSEILRKTSDGWEPFTTIPFEDDRITSIIGFDRTGRVMYMVDSRGRNTVALTAIDLDTGETTVIAADPRADVAGVMKHPTEKTIQAVAFVYLRPELRVLDDSIAPDLEYLGKVADGVFNVISRTQDDNHWLVAYLRDDGPVPYYRYDRTRKEARFLFTHREALEGQPLVRMHPVVIKSRDGLDLVSYYSVPAWSDRERAGRPAQPLPMALLVHGGPWNRDKWGYHPWHQSLANRGYAVLSVNFRASSGFGKDFLNAGNLEWGAKMHDDLLDAVQWAIDQGIADPQRVAITGGSYGGYATLWGLTATPDTFACGVDIVGPSNLVTLLSSVPPYWAAIIERQARQVGDYRTAEGRAFLTERSPLTHAERISKPLLIGQGANDPRVKQAEAEQIVQAMQDKDLPVTYILYPDEGHGFRRPENNLSFQAVMEVFLAECLGGRHEPAGDDFEGSSITVPVGAEHIPGLAEALK